MPALLLSLDGQADIPLDRDLIVIGRYHRCDVRLDSHRVSRHHCCLSPEGDEVAVRDLDSTNGTYLNGRRIQTGRLRPGDELKVGGFLFRLVLDTPRSPTVAATDPGSGEHLATDPEALETSIDGLPKPQGSSDQGICGKGSESDPGTLREHQPADPSGPSGG